MGSEATPSRTAKPTEPTAQKNICVVAVESVYIREGPDALARSVGFYYRGDNVELLEVSPPWGRAVDGWFRIDAQGADCRDGF